MVNTRLIQMTTHFGTGGGVGQNVADSNQGGSLKGRNEMISNEAARRWRRTRLLFVLSVLLVAPLPLVAQSGSTDKDVAASDAANQAKQVVVAKHETKGFDHTLKVLKEKPIFLEINDAPMSDLIGYFSKAPHLQFKFESDDITKRRVTIHVSPERSLN